MRKSGKMASHNELGKEGENAAVEDLLEKGYEIRRLMKLKVCRKSIRMIYAIKRF